ncbi:MAG: hypothetical protein ACOVLB_05465 [Candidatus Nanopelagicus sp.]
MQYQTVEIEGVDGLEQHIIIEKENGEYLTFPKLDSNPNYIQFKLDLAEEQK